MRLTCGTALKAFGGAGQFRGLLATLAAKFATLAAIATLTRSQPHSTTSPPSPVTATILTNSPPPPMQLLLCKGLALLSRVCAQTGRLPRSRPAALADHAGARDEGAGGRSRDDD